LPLVINVFILIHFYHHNECIMKKMYLLLSWMLLGSWLLSQAQYSPRFSQVLSVENPRADTLTDYPVLLTVNTEALVTAGSLAADGRDLRFGTACLGDTLDYWIQDFFNTDSTLIWVRVPVLLANSDLEIEMYYGDSTATAASDFAATFPTALITSGNVTLTNTTNDIAWLQVNAGDTLFIGVDTLLTIDAVVADISGVVMGVGAGYSGGTSGPIVGQGPGAGGTSSNSGSGGGGYGGAGGLGGLDAGDSPGAGGSTYGSTKGMGIQPGSGGGGSSSVDGGNGGGAFQLSADRLFLSGSIIMDGAEGEQPGGGQGAGGGSGGGILLMGHTVALTGTLSAAGGRGSIGTSTANDDGGGGGGGRIKVFSDLPLVNTATFNVAGGLGGPNGGASGGEDGLTGTTFDTTQTYLLTSVSFGQVFDLRTDAEATICQGDSLLLGGAFQGTPGIYVDTLVNLRGCDSLVITDLSFLPSYAENTALEICDGDSVQLAGAFRTTSGVYVDSLSSVDGCDSVMTTTLTVAPSIDTTITQVSNTLISSATNATYQWIDCAGNTPIAGATTPFYTATTAGNYAVIVSQGDCEATSRCVSLTLTSIAETLLDQITVSPNPSQGLFTLRLPRPMPGLAVRLFTADGRALSLPIRSDTQQVKVDLSGHPSGLYVLRLQQGAQQGVMRLIKR
jgi:hypothetical protein